MINKFDFDRCQISRSVRKKVESDEMTQIINRKFKTQALFLIATMLLTLHDKGLSKEELINYQQSFSDKGRELAKETNSADIYSALTKLEEVTGIKSDNKTDMFI